MWFVYVLLCEDSSLYTGISNDVQKRFEDHIKGKGGAYTKSHRPTKMLFVEHHPDRSSALKREFEIKSWTREEKIKKLHLDLKPRV